MGKNKARDENAATSSDARDREQESRDTALARTIAQAVAEAFAKQKVDETQDHHRNFHKADGEDSGAI